MRQITIAAALLLAACGSGEAPEPAQAAPESPDSSVFEPLTDSLDRARGVEDTLRDAEAARRRQLEAQE